MWPSDGDDKESKITSLSLKLPIPGIDDKPHIQSFILYPEQTKSVRTDLLMKI